MISVIIPTYNNEKELEKCLESLELQTYKDFEIIIVDDGSEQPISGKLQDTSYKIQVIPHGGANKARNEGFKHAKGEYLLFCDSDIELKPDALEKMLKALSEHPEAAYAYSSFRYGLKGFKLHSFDPEKLKEMNFIHTTSLIRREAFPGFDTKIKRFQDWDLWLTMLEKGHTGTWIPEELFKVRTGSGTMSRWLPKGIYKLAKRFGIKIKRVEEYEKAKQVIYKKHGLDERSLNVH